MRARGGGRRFCERCRRDVHDLIQLPEREARRVPPGACIRSTADRRGRLLFADALVAAPVLAGVLLAGCATASTRIVDAQPVTVIGEVPAPPVVVSAPPVQASHARPPAAAEPVECDPPEGRAVVVVSMGIVATIEGIHFGRGEDTLPDTATAVLDEIAKVLAENPQIERVRVSGHTDDRGSAKAKQRISTRRAEAVVDYLVGKGIDTERLVPVGVADAFPLDSNATPHGRARNRRVEFEIEQ